MQTVTFDADRYSFRKERIEGVAHWRHVVAQMRIVISASTRLQHIEVSSGGLRLVNMNYNLDYPKIRCGGGYILAFDSAKSHFQLKLDPKSYAKAMTFLQKLKIHTELVYTHTSRPNSVVSHSGMLPDLASSTGGLPSSSTGYARVPSSKMQMGSPEALSILSSPGCFNTYLPWVDENVVADTKLSGPVSRYGRCAVGYKSWRFLLRTSHIACSIKRQGEFIHLLVFLDERAVHCVDLRRTPIVCSMSTIRFSDRGTKIQLEMSKEFVYGLVLELRKLEIQHTFLETSTPVHPVTEYIC